MGIFKLVKDFVESEDFELFTFQSGDIKIFPFVASGVMDTKFTFQSGDIQIKKH